MSEQSEIQLYKPAVYPLAQRPLTSSAPYALREGNPELGTYWRILRNRRRTVLAIFLVVFFGVLLGTVLQTPVYRATGLLEIRKENANAVSVETLFQLESITDDYLETQFGLLKSATLAERVIGELQLDKQAEFNPPASWLARMWPGGSQPTEAEVRQAIVERFQKRLLIDPLKGSRLVNVSFESEDPRLAAQAVNAILSKYIELRVEDGQRTAEWLSKQLGTARGTLEESEGKLHEYVRAHGLQLLETEQGNAENLVNERLRHLQEQLTQAQAARFEKESQYSLIRKRSESTLSATHLDNKVIQDLAVMLTDLRREYATLTTTFRGEYPKLNQVKKQIEELEAAKRDEYERAANRVHNDYLAALGRENLLRLAFDDQQRLANVLADRLAGYNILKRDVETNKQLYAVLQQKLKEIGVSATLKATNVGVVDLAQPPRTPYRPQLPLNLALAGAVGLVLGAGGAFLREYLDTTMKTADEVDVFLGLPALGMVPSIESLSRGRAAVWSFSNGKRWLLGGTRPRPQLALASRWYRIDREGRQYQALAEAFGGLRSSVLLEANGQSPRVLLITSSQPGEGKSTVSVNLAISLARMGRRVLLIDGDTRRPSVHHFFGLKNLEGLLNHLATGVDWRYLVCRNVISGLHVITAGWSANPAELLCSPRLRELISAVRAEYDFVLVDSPALFIHVADARILSSLVEGVVVVVRSGMTSRELAQRALGQVRNVMGVVLNGVDVELLPDYYQEYLLENGKGGSGIKR